MTSTGQFWHEFMELFPENEKAEIKKKMFAEVFYSKEQEKWWKRFAKEFKTRYPNVYRHINRWKQPETDLKLTAYMGENNIEVENTATALSIAMMKLESSIFKDILSALYRKRISAVHIHDAIVIPDVKGTKNVQEESIVEIMRKSYKKYGLYPSFSIETSL